MRPWLRVGREGHALLPKRRDLEAVRVAILCPRGGEMHTHVGGVFPGVRSLREMCLFPPVSPTCQSGERRGDVHGRGLQVRRVVQVQSRVRDCGGGDEDVRGGQAVVRGGPGVQADRLRVAGVGKKCRLKAL